MAKMGLAAAAAAGITPQPNALQPKPVQYQQPPAAVPAQAPVQRETVVLCPPNLVGRVIGRGGETINNLQVAIPFLNIFTEKNESFMTYVVRVCARVCMQKLYAVEV